MSAFPTTYQSYAPNLQPVTNLSTDLNILNTPNSIIILSIVVVVVGFSILSLVICYCFQQTAPKKKYESNNNSNESNESAKPFELISNEDTFENESIIRRLGIIGVGNEI